MTIWYIPNKKVNGDNCIICNKPINFLTQEIKTKYGYVCVDCITTWIEDYNQMLNPWNKSEWV
jgi:hypothetical protein